MPEEKDKIKDKILNKIENDKISPTPRWCFVCKNYASWFVVILSGLIISLSLSLMIFLFISHDWDVYQLESGYLARHILVYTPFIWILIFLLFILLASFWFNKTKEGYKFVSFKTLIVSVLLVIILSSASVNDKPLTNATSSTSLFIAISKTSFWTFVKLSISLFFFVRDKCDIWDEPEKGLLSGKVLEIVSDEEFILNDFNNNSWQVREENIKIIPPEFIVEKGGNIKMIGRLCSSCGNNIFIVNTIKPW